MLRISAISLICSGILAIFTSSSVLAGVSAVSLLDMDNFIAEGSDGEVLDFNADFGFLTFRTTADEVVSLGINNDSRTSALSPINLPVICVGTCQQITDDTFPVISGAPTADYSTADQFETGSPVDNVPLPDNSGVFETPAHVAIGSYVAIAEENLAGSTDTNNNLNSSFQFLLDQDQGVTFSFDMRAYHEAFVSGIDIFPSFATAAYEVSFAIDNLSTNTRVFEWKPDGNGGSITGGTVNSDPFTLNHTVSLNAPLPADFTNTGGIHTPGTASSGHFSATTDILTAGHIYQVSLRQVANVDARLVDVPIVADACRLTGGGVATDETTDGQTYLVWDGSLIEDVDVVANRYTFGGQAGANTALPPQPKGEWQHNQHSGPAGSFSFHTGTASAPTGTEIVEIRCSDPGGCAPSGNPPSPNKQLDFDCIGTFKNIANGKRAPNWRIAGANVTAEGNGNRTFDGTFHWCEVNVDDLGEGPDPAEGDNEACPAEGFGEKGVATLPANCDCPDFYRITIYDGINAADVVWDENGNIVPSSLNQTDVIYEVEGYLGRGGNGLQLHSLTGFDRK